MPEPLKTLEDASMPEDWTVHAKQVFEGGDDSYVGFHYQSFHEKKNVGRWLVGLRA